MRVGRHPRRRGRGGVEGRDPRPRLGCWRVPVAILTRPTISSTSFTSVRPFLASRVARVGSEGVQKSFVSSSRACLFPRLPHQVLAHILSSAVPSRSLAIAIGLPRSRRSLNSTPRRLSRLQSVSFTQKLQGYSRGLVFFSLA